MLSISRSKGYAIRQISIFTAGIAISTAIYSAAKQTIFPKGTYYRADELVRVESRIVGFDYPQPVPLMRFLSLKEADCFSSVQATTTELKNIRVGIQVVGAICGRTTSGYFETLGVENILGSTFTPGVIHEAIVTTEFAAQWLERGGSVGTPIIIDNISFEVVGILPPGFRAPGTSAGTSVYYTDLEKKIPRDSAEIFLGMNTVARLKPGYSLATADAIVKSLQPERGGPYEKSLEKYITKVTAIDDFSNFPIEERTKRIFGIAVWSGNAVFVFSCISFLQLLALRMLTKRGEVNVRMSVGAARSRAELPHFIETGILLLTGVILGAIIGAGILRVLPTILPNSGTSMGIPSPFQYRAYFTFIGIYVFCASVAHGANIILTKHQALRSFSRDNSKSTTLTRLVRIQQRLVVGMQIVVATTMIGLMIWSIFTVVQFQSTRLNFETKNRFILSVVPPLGQTPERRMQRFEAVLARIKDMRSIETAALASKAVPSNPTPIAITLSGEQGDRQITTDSVVVGKGFFESLNIRKNSAVDLGAHDAAGRKIALVNDAFIRRHMNGKYSEGRVFATIDGVRFEIVGNVADVQTFKFPPRPTVYFSVSQQRSWLMEIVVVSKESAATDVLMQLRQAIYDVAPGFVVIGLAPASKVLNDQILLETHLMTIISCLAITAACLVFYSIYGTTSYISEQRIPEWGVRFALGATLRRLLFMILMENAQFMGIAVLLGSAVGAYLTRVLSYTLEMSPFSAGYIFMYSLGVSGALCLAATVWAGNVLFTLDITASLKK